MGLDYALVHIKYTIPPAILLTLLYRPFLTKLDLYKIAFLITVAFTATVPWDSYLIRQRIWSYPSHAVAGPTFFKIPLEECFFFIIQTYNTSLLHLLFSKPTFHPIYLCHEPTLTSTKTKGRQWRVVKILGQAALAFTIRYGIILAKEWRTGTYMGLILAWATPVLLFIWTIAYQFIVGLPFSNTLLPIALPTLYLWVVDTFALRRGTWVIEVGTKLGVHVWEGLEVEEAVFFLATNTLIVCGLVAFEYALAVLHTFPDKFPKLPQFPSPWLLLKACATAPNTFDQERLEALILAVEKLKKKSRSFFLASGVFEGRLRIDLIVLYAFCRVADDLIDDAASVSEAQAWIRKLAVFLDLSYKPERSEKISLSIPPEASDFIAKEFPVEAQQILRLLPTAYLPREPLDDLLKGFEMDAEFLTRKESRSKSSWPMGTDEDLTRYGHCVAGTVAELCIELVFHHVPTDISPEMRKQVLQAGRRMGVALQYVNISRDIAVDARMERVYIPASWLKEEGITHEEVIEYPKGPKIEKLRGRLLDTAFKFYEESKDAIDLLPTEARGPMKVAVESYMEIGRVLRQQGYEVKAGRATVPKSRRLITAWKALNRG